MKIISDNPWLRVKKENLTAASLYEARSQVSGAGMYTAKPKPSRIPLSGGASACFGFAYRPGGGGQGSGEPSLVTMFLHLLPFLKRNNVRLLRWAYFRNIACARYLLNRAIVSYGGARHPRAIRIGPGPAARHRCAKEIVTFSRNSLPLSTKFFRKGWESRAISRAATYVLAFTLGLQLFVN